MSPAFSAANFSAGPFFVRLLTDSMLPPNPTALQRKPAYPSMKCTTAAPAKAVIAHRRRSEDPARRLAPMSRPQRPSRAQGLQPSVRPDVDPLTACRANFQGLDGPPVPSAGLAPPRLGERAARPRHALTSIETTPTQPAGCRKVPVARSTRTRHVNDVRVPRRDDIIHRGGN